MRLWLKSKGYGRVLFVRIFEKPFLCSSLPSPLLLCFLYIPPFCLQLAIFALAPPFASLLAYLLALLTSSPEIVPFKTSRFGDLIWQCASSVLPLIYLCFMKCLLARSFSNTEKHLTLLLEHRLSVFFVCVHCAAIISPPLL